ncbi:MAG: AraC family transcriptional regulator, partial [Gammaproteobacteria bacterium]|nr:AraC family transcriptional regulator [Gammaproteobacteria bacterium]NIV77147.1 helix-turn-helix domain-containing protein [Gammaproteobacteria bacterium]
RYQMRLRLARSLVRLESCEELTDLALDLGFSSHSHFTAAFRAAFGVPPSVYRKQVRNGRERLHEMIRPKMLKAGGW